MPILATLDPRTLFDASPNPYVLLDTELRIVAANQAYLRVTMRDAASLLGRVVFDAFPSAPDSPHGRQLRQSFARVLAQRSADQLASIHYPIPRADGGFDDRYWSATHTPLLHADGSVRFILQHTEDVTELVQLRAQVAPLSTTAAHLGQRASAVAAANLALGAERDVLRQMFEQTPGLLAVMRGPDHVLEIVNTALHQLLGERPLQGLPVRQALPELEGQGFFDWLDQVYRSGEPFSGRDVQALLRRRPGGPLEARRADFLYQPLRDAEGRVQGVMMQGQDITAQVRAQRQAVASAARFQTLAHAMPNQVWTAQADGQLDWCNAQTEEYSGLPQSALVGAGWVDIVHPDDRVPAGSAWRAALDSAQPYNIGFRLRRHDGVYRWHIARALPLRDEAGRVSQWVGTNTDIDDQKRSAELLHNLNDELARRVDERSAELAHTQAALRQSQKLESIGLLADGIAHDFNNLLQVISGSLQLALRRLDDATETGVLMARAMDGVQRGTRLVAQLLAFSRRQPLAPQVIHLGSLVRGMDDLLRQSLGRRIAFDTRIDAGLWHTLADPVQVESALLNLALNARDAMGGQGRLTLEAGNAWLDEGDGQGPYVMLAVSDTGCGMAPEVLQRAFEPFFTTKPAGQSSGLGLSMVYGFIKQSQGHVRVHSEVGVGTTVRLYLPRSTQGGDEDGPPPSAAPQTQAATSPAPLRVLLCEDDDLVRETLGDLLQELGCQVWAAADMGQARSLLPQCQPQLLITDLGLPDGDGRQLAAWALDALPGLQVAIASGQGTITSGREAAAGRPRPPTLPHALLLPKPFDVDTLAALLDQVRAGIAAAR